MTAASLGEALQPFQRPLEHGRRLTNLKVSLARQTSESAAYEQAEAPSPTEPARINQLRVALPARLCPTARILIEPHLQAWHLCKCKATLLSAG